MADVKISALPAGAAVAGTDIHPAVQAGVTVKTTETQVATWLAASGLIPPLVVNVTVLSVGPGNTVLQQDGSATFSQGNIIVGPAATIELGSGNAGILKVNNAAAVTQINLDGATAALTVGNTVNGSITVKNNAGTTQISIITGFGPAISIGDGVNAGTLIVQDAAAGNAVIISGSATSRIKARDGDIEVTNSASGLILTSPDATRWRVTVDNAGQLSVNPA